eukprot:1753122-Rhodomonas_salina.2
MAERAEPKPAPHLVEHPLDEADQTRALSDAQPYQENQQLLLLGVRQQHLHLGLQLSGLRLSFQLAQQRPQLSKTKRLVQDAHHVVCRQLLPPTLASALAFGMAVHLSQTLNPKL